MGVAETSVNPEIWMSAVDGKEFVLVRLDGMEVESGGLNQIIFTAGIHLEDPLGVD